MGVRKAGADNFHADADQVRTVEEYAGRHGAAVEFMAPELSVSGGKPIEERPALVAAIKGVESGRYQGIVVAYLSRLTRSRSGLEIWTRVEAAGGSVHCAAEALDTSTPNGRFIRDIHLANAVREREEHGEAHRRRREAATAAGIWQRHQTPRGYLRDAGTRRLVPDGDAGLVVDQFKARASGATLGDVAQALGMTPSGAAHLLGNRVYLGELKVGPYVNASAHPAIVPADLFAVVQAARGVRPPRQTNFEASWATGLVRCQACGYRMTRSNSGRYAQFTCRILHSGARCPAPSSIAVKRLERYLDAVVRQELSGINLRPSRRTGEGEKLREHAARMRAELDAYVVAVSAADIGAQAFAAGASTRRKAVEEADAAVARIDQLASPHALSGEAALKAWVNADTARRGVIARAVIETVIVRASGRGSVMPADERVRVIDHGTGLVVGAHDGAKPMGVHALPWPDLGSPHILRVVGFK